MEVSRSREGEEMSNEPLGNASEPGGERDRVSAAFGRSKPVDSTHIECSTLGSKPAVRPSNQDHRMREGNSRRRGG